MITVPWARSLSLGAASCSHMSTISPGTPGMAMMIVPSFSAHQPGAVPRGLGSTVTEGMTPACFLLVSGISCPRPRKFSSIAAMRSGSSVMVSPNVSAMASRVRSSFVGPRPPVQMMRSERSRHRCSISTISPISSPMMVTVCRSMPSAGSRAAMWAELVSTVSPIRSSVPKARISARMRASPLVQVRDTVSIGESLGLAKARQE